tara:strand:+ start:1152 stop:2051 length:900 start_codon:yes stop_codon:yes gene_type:complete
MEKILTVVSNINNSISSSLLEAIKDNLESDVSLNWLCKKTACDIYFQPNNPDLAEANFNKIKYILEENKCDWAIQNKSLRTKKLFLSDMDSTIIRQECIEEIANHAGKGIKEKIQEITKIAMSGGMKFSDALEKRVKLLKGINISLLNTIYNNSIELSPGSDVLLKNLVKNNIHSILISGGFTYFTEKIAKSLNFHEHYGNILEIDNDRLSGKVTTPILDGAFKKQIVENYIDENNLLKSDIIAVGDGANDIGMIQSAGLGIGYKAKPVLKEFCNGQINYTDLMSILYFLGFSNDDITS